MTATRYVPGAEAAKSNCVVPPTTVATGIVAYSMIVAGFVMLGAKLVQRFSALRVFRVAVVVFGVGVGARRGEQNVASVGEHRGRFALA